MSTNPNERDLQARQRVWVADERGHEFPGRLLSANGNIAHVRLYRWKQPDLDLWTSPERLRPMTKDDKRGAKRKAVKKA